MPNHERRLRAWRGTNVPRPGSQVLLASTQPDAGRLRRGQAAEPKQIEKEKTMSKDVELQATSNPSRQASTDGTSEKMRERVQQRAYELYLERGAEPGHELEDWTRAEAEFLHQSKIHRAA